MPLGAVVYSLRLLVTKGTGYWANVMDLLEYYRTADKKDRFFADFYEKVKREDIEWEDVRKQLLRFKFIDPPKPVS